MRGGDLTVDAGYSVTVGQNFFRILLRVLRALEVAPPPIDVHAQDDVPLVFERPLDNARAIENIGVCADESIGHMLFGTKQRGEDIVVRPVVIVAIRELRIVGANHVDLISADEHGRVHSRPRESFEQPVQNPPVAYGRV